MGGFYADDNYGCYIIESRQTPVAILEASILGERDFLFANNSVNHPQAIEPAWMSRIRDEWS